ncbi:hypothetical protein [Lactiplantibacillus xiangfangensis]
MAITSCGAPLLFLANFAMMKSRLNEWVVVLWHEDKQLQRPG